ncbi:MAG TPA: nucleotidyltransferase family protein [Methanospirillum sp.]|nr:nucleotidyltransferase family protein [Methanospirillum sp.]
MISLLRNCPLPSPDISENDWNLFFNTIPPHWIGSLLLFLIHNTPDSKNVPSWVYHRLQELFRSDHNRSLHTEVQIRSLSNICSDAGIDFLVIKGPALGQMIYPHPAMRTGSDIDLLVAEDQIPNLKSALCMHGYHIRFDSYAVSKNLFHHLIFFPDVFPSDTHRLPVEAHWRPLVLTGTGGSVTIPSLISESVEISTGLATFKTLTLADAFVYAAAHMCIFHAGMLRLIWIADIAYLIREITRTNQWDLVIARCREWECTMACREALTQASLWFDQAPPIPYNSSLFWPEATENEKKVFLHLSLRKEGYEIHLHEQIQEMPTIREKCLAIYYFLARTDTILMNVPNLSWWRYPTYWLHLVRKEFRKNR